MKPFSCLLLLLALISTQVTANPSLETPPSSSTISQDFLNSRLVEETLFLSTAFIESETALLNKKPYRLSQDEIELLRYELNVRFNPEAIKKSLLINLQQEPDNIQQGLFELNTVLSSELASQLSSARQEAVQANESAIVYQETLDLKSVQEHRFQIVRTYDGLLKLSVSQSLIFQQIQDSIRSSLNDKQRSRYKVIDEAARLEELKQFNQSLSLYAFRQVPAKDFVAFFNALATPSVQAALDAYEKNLRKSLDDRAKLKYLIENP